MKEILSSINEDREQEDIDKVKKFIRDKQDAIKAINTKIDKLSDEEERMWDEYYRLMHSDFEVVLRLVQSKDIIQYEGFSNDVVCNSRGATKSI